MPFRHAFFRLSRLLGLLLMSHTAAVADWTATGQFNYTDRNYDLNGFTVTEARPVREADVQIYDLATQAVLASGATDSNGNFSIVVTDAATRDVGVRVLSSNVQVASLNFSVVDDKNSNAVYSYHDALSDVLAHAPSDNVDFATMTMPAAIGAVETTDWSSQVFNTYDMGVLLADWIQSADGARPAVFYTILWNATNGRTGSFYNGGSNLLSLSDDDAYDDPNILHEIGHYIEDEYGRSRNTGGTHFIGDNDQDPRLAYSEGFATFVSAAALNFGGRSRPDVYQDRDSFSATNNTGFAYSYEAGTVGGATNEQAVTAAMYDLIDGTATADASPTTDDETLSGLQSSVWQVVEQMRVVNPATTQMEDFWDIWFSLGLGNATAMATIFASHNIDFATDAQEPNNTPATSTLLTVGAAYQRNCFYRTGVTAGGDEDWFRFVATAGTYYWIEVNGAANSLFSRPDPELWLLNPALTSVLAYNDDPYDSVLNTQSSGSAQDMAETVPSILWQAPTSGTYYLYLRHASQERNLLGRYGTYNLRVRSVAVPTPTVTQMAEQRMLPGQTYQALVIGTNFSRGAVVTTSAAEVTVNAVTWMSTTALVVHLTPAAGTPDGSYSISVRNPGGNAGTLANALEVSSAAQPPVMITELDLNADAVELRNLGSVTATLTGWQVRSFQPNSTAQTFTFPSFTLAAGATVVVREASGTNTATDLYNQGAAFNWPWLNGSSGDVSLIDDGGRNVDFFRVVSSPHSTHSAPQGTGGAWLPPQIGSPPSGFGLSRAEQSALYRTPYGLDWAALTIPAGAAGRSNNTDSWENNDQPRRCQIFGPAAVLSGLRISSRSSGTDNDWFGFIVKPGEELQLKIAFTHSAGNLNMELYAPGEESTPLSTANSTTNEEVITLTNVQSMANGGGIYRLRVFGAGGAVNPYTLTVGPTVSIAVSDATASESQISDTAQFTLSRTGSLTLPLSVQLGFSGAAANGSDFTTVSSSLTLPAEASTATITITPIADTLAEGSETLTVTLLADPVYNLGTVFSANASIQDPTVDAWRFFYFNGNPPLSADDEDFDRDGTANLIEYALNMNPTLPNRSGLPEVDQETDLGTRYLTLTYARDLTKPDITYQVQSSLLLSGWSDVSDLEVSTTGNIQTRRARVVIDDTDKFMRLKVTRP